MLKICCKRLREDAKLPSKSKDPRDAGFDLFSTEEFQLQPGERKTIKMGIIVWFEPVGAMMDLSWYGRIAPKSGLASRSGVDVLAGVIDRTYCGPGDELRVCLLNTGFAPVIFEKGEAIAQIIPEVIWSMTGMIAEERDSVPEAVDRGSGIDRPG